MFSSIELPRKTNFGIKIGQKKNLLHKTNFECFQSKEEKNPYTPKYEKAQPQLILYMPEKK